MTGAVGCLVCSLCQLVCVDRKSFVCRLCRRVGLNLATFVTKSRWQAVQQYGCRLNGRHDLKASGSKRKQSADGLCEASSEASEPGEGGGLRRSKRRRSGGGKRAHVRHGASWRSWRRRVVCLGACRGRRGTCDEREARAVAKMQVLVVRPRPMKSLGKTADGCDQQSQLRQRVTALRRCAAC